MEKTDEIKVNKLLERFEVIRVEDFSKMLDENLFKDFKDDLNFILKDKDNKSIINFNDVINKVGVDVMDNFFFKEVDLLKSIVDYIK